MRNKSFAKYQELVRQEAFASAGGDYERHYCFGDRGVLADVLRRGGPGCRVAETATGPNIITPHVLRAVGLNGYTYVSVDVCLKYIGLHRAGLAAERLGAGCYHVLGTAGRLPLPDGWADVFVWHHAINDIWASDGMEGVREALGEALRILRPGGLLASSHAVYESAASTKAVSHDDVRGMLDGLPVASCEAFDGPSMDWLIIAKSDDRSRVGG